VVAAVSCVVATGDEYRQFFSLVLARRFVYWDVDYGAAEGGSALQRRRIPSRSCAQRGRVETLRRANLGGSPTLHEVAVTRGRVFYTRSFPQPTTLREMTDPLVRDP
jgi:hypothetical protein